MPPVSEIRLYFDNTPADDGQLGLFSQIKVDQAIGMAAEAELHLGLGTDDSGLWSHMEEDFVQVFSRVRIEVKIRNGDFVPLIDGPIVGQRFDLSGEPNSSTLVLIVQDDSILLNQEEEVVLYEEQSPDDIAQALFARYGLAADTDAVSTSSGGPARSTVQRGSAMQLLRELARRNGMFVYVKPGDSPGSSTGMFKQAVFTNGEYPDLLLMGADRNINTFSASFDGLRPLTARADNIDITNLNQLTSETEQSDIDPQGSTAVHAMVDAGKTLLARTGSETSDLDAATLAAVNYSSWAYTASAEVVADNYAAVLTPYTLVKVVGVGGYLSGDWLISQVTHSITDESYRQQFTLRRNAGSGGVGGGGSLPGGIF